MKSRFPRGAAAACLAALALTALSLPLTAQCLGPDNLNGTCWQPTMLSLPQLPQMQQRAQGVCWSSCAVGAQNCLDLIIGPPTPTLQCGVLEADISVSDCAGIQLMGGVLRFDYTRTWDEVDFLSPPSRRYQVWRFAVKADLSGNFLQTPVCPVPRCLGPEPDAFFYGYVDYALECGTNVWESSAVLFHNCDRYIHRPGISSKPGNYHAGEMYAIVAPDTPANPFVPALSVAPPAGPLVAEAVRNVRSTLGPAACVAEEFVTSGQLQPFLQGCSCQLAFQPQQQAANHLTGLGSCPDATGTVSGFTALNATTAGAPWLELISTFIGCWTTGNTYPGPECAWTDEGVFLYHDSCIQSGGFVAGADFIDIFYGASTVDGFPVVPSPLFPPGPQFLDLATNYSSILPGQAVPPYVGSVKPSEHLIYVNMP